MTEDHRLARLPGTLLRVAGLGAALALGACATLDRDECLRADWSRIGLEDGRAGHAVGRLAEHRKACAEHGVAPDEPRYLAARVQGLMAYCVFDRAQSEGLAGRRYQPGVCPPTIDGDFARLNEAAWQVQDARRRVQSLHQQAERIEREWARKDLDDKRRAALRSEQAQNDRQLQQARDELRWRERDLDRVRADLRPR